MYRKVSEELLDFLKGCSSMFHAVAKIKEVLVAEGYSQLDEKDRWDVKVGGKYFVVRNDSSIIAFNVGEDLEKYSFKIVASHSDSPTFKIKEKAELTASGKYGKLNTEGYGGMILSTWLDRPLSVAGRIMVREAETGKIESRLVRVDRDLVLIPNVAIHMNRQINKGFEYNKQVDMMPLFAGADFEKGDFLKLIAKEAGVKEEDVLATDLYLYNRMKPSVWGANGEFISAARLDDLQCAFSSLKAFTAVKECPAGVNLMVCLDNEEVGSGTKQGAEGTFLYDCLRRINSCLGKTEEDYYRAVASSFMISADNAHAVHPNHPEKTDAENCVYMNEGIVIKCHAEQKYTSDAVSMAIFKNICQKADVPVQLFSNRSDATGGSTLGNIVTGSVSVNAIDVGLPQLAMHSSYETAGVKDTAYMIAALKEFFKN